jgi:predicted CopG family antitoxin
MSRAYRLKQGESVSDEVRRIARGRIDHAVEALAEASEEGVHEARKDMKKLRSLLRLVRLRGEGDRFRDVARELAGARDADVMLATLADLESRYGADAGAVRERLEAHRIRTAGGGRARAAEAATAMLEEARGRVGAWPLERDGFDAVEDGLGRIYRRGRRDWRTAAKDPSTENLHEWRKRVKDLWYHCLLLQEAWPPVMRALADDHDLALLSEFGAEPLEERIAERRTELQAEAFAYGARLYADKPKAFVRRIEHWSRPVLIPSSR